MFGIIATILIAIGTSYALWTTTEHQTGVNIVQSTCLKLTLTNEKNEIGLDNAFPLTDEQGRNLEPYTFTITNVCETPIDYTLALEMLNETTLNSEFVKYQLTEDSDKTISYLNTLDNEPTEESTQIDGATEGRVLLEDTIEKNKSKIFNLRLWIDEGVTLADSITGQTFKSKVAIQGVIAKPGMIRTIAEDDINGMWQYKDKITKLIIEDKIKKPDGSEVLGPFDESRYKDESVISYLVKNGEEDAYTAYLQGDGGFTLNYNSVNLFYKFNKVTSIEGIENLNTSKTRNMESMFSYMQALVQLDLRDKFDTRNVTDMKSMFYRTESLTSLDLGDKFDTSQVTNMSWMFYYMSTLEALDLKDKFDTSKVTDMSKMFAFTKATQLDLSKCNFDTSNVTNMSGMFYMSKLTSLNLGDKFNTSKVTNMSEMFSDMNELTQLNLGDKFNTSQVTNMERMFYYMRALVQLDLKDKFDTSNVTNMKRMFFNSNQLKTIEYGNKFIHNEEADIRDMFYSCPAPKPTKETHPSWDGVGFD